jgi:hypothetical protein
MKPDKQCVVRGVRKGSKYGLWVDHHVYELEPQSKAIQYAAKDVSVTGWLDGETIRGTRARLASEYPRQGPYSLVGGRTPSTAREMWLAASRT